MDNLDQLVKMFITKRKINRWPMVLFMNMVDVATIAAFIIWMRNFPDWKLPERDRCRQIYLRQLGHSLVMPHMKRRADTAILRAPIRAAMILLGVRKTLPVDMTVQHSTGKSTWKKVLTWLLKHRQGGANSCYLLSHVSMP